MKVLFFASFFLAFFVWAAVVGQERDWMLAPAALQSPQEEAIEEQVPSRSATFPEIPVVAEEEAPPQAAPAQPGPLRAPELPRPAAGEPVEYTEEYVELLERAIHDRVNTERVREGLGILRYSEELAAVAALHSTDMAENNYFAHEDDEGCDSACRVNTIGYRWRTVGENLFLLRSSYRYPVADTSAIIVQGWMGSAGHRKNVLEGSFTEQGLGVVIDGNSIYTTQVLARPR